MLNAQGPHHGGRFRYRPGDREAVAAMVASAVAGLGGLDVLLNNAGIGGPTGPVHELDPTAWDAVLRVNLSGTFDVTRNAIAHLIRSGGGTFWLCQSQRLLRDEIELGPHNTRVNAHLRRPVARENVAFR